MHKRMRFQALHEVEPDKRAMQEWQLLQGIIGRVEDLEYRMRGWLLLLFAALVAAHFRSGGSGALEVSGCEFFILSLLLVVMFFMAEFCVRIPKRKAIDRVSRIELALRGKIAYDGPCISDSLTGGWDTATLKSMFASEVRTVHFWAFYCAIVVIALVLALS